MILLSKKEMKMNDDPGLQNIDFAANIAQFISLFLLLKDASNNEIMEELAHQNKEYLQKIVEQNELIIKLLQK